METLVFRDIEPVIIRREPKEISIRIDDMKARLRASWSIEDVRRDCRVLFDEKYFHDEDFPVDERIRELARQTASDLRGGAEDPYHLEPQVALLGLVDVGVQLTIGLQEQFPNHDPRFIEQVGFDFINRQLEELFLGRDGIPRHLAVPAKESTLRDRFFYELDYFAYMNSK